MTIFAVMCALTFPGIHVGRVWVAYWMFPLPNQMGTWPNFRSPLLWDVFAVSIYGTVSILFWYVGLIPDLATIRDRAKPDPKVHLRDFRPRMAGLGAAVAPLRNRLPDSRRASRRRWSSRFTRSSRWTSPVSLLPGWHTTVFPPYFVAGAIFSGFAMVLTLMVICRWAFHLEHIVTLRHFDYMAKIMLVTGTMVGYAYATEFFTAWYSGQPLRALRLPEPRARTVRVGLLDHGQLQRDQPPGLLVQEGTHEHPDPVHAVDHHQHRHVVRAVRDHRDVAAP
jgi:molybdopterin-containing oxidoreductase family membrane subunit